jgi:hypothetical protein
MSSQWYMTMDSPIHPREIAGLLCEFMEIYSPIITWEDKLLNIKLYYPESGPSYMPCVSGAHKGLRASIKGDYGFEIDIQISFNDSITTPREIAFPHVMKGISGLLKAVAGNCELNHTYEGELFVRRDGQLLVNKDFPDWTPDLLALLLEPYELRNQDAFDLPMVY